MTGAAVDFSAALAALAARSSGVPFFEILGFREWTRRQAAYGNLMTVTPRLPGPRVEYVGGCPSELAGASAREGVCTALPPKSNGYRRHTFLQTPQCRNGVSWRPS